MCGTDMADFSTLLVEFYIWILFGKTKLLTSENVTVDYIRNLVSAIGFTVTEVLKISNMCKIAVYEKCLLAIREYLDEFVALRYSTEALQYTFKQDTIERDRIMQCAVPEIVLPPILVDVQVSTLQSILRLSVANLDKFDILGEASALQMLTWLESIQKDQHLFVQVILRRVENWMFVNMITLSETADVSVLLKILEKYRTFLQGLVTPANKDVAAIELQSRETLVTWVTYCMVDFVVRGSNKLMGAFGVSLNFLDLKHLVLQDEMALSTLLRVCDYLKKFNGVPPVFSLHSNDATFNMALTFSLQSSSILTIWKNEEDAAELRVAKHWEEVLRKQALVRKLENDIVAKESEIKITESFDRKQHCNTEHAHNLVERNRVDVHNAAFTLDGKKYTKFYTEFRSFASYTDSYNLKSLKSALVQLEADLVLAHKAPLSIVQPLPSNKSDCLTALFFLYMPIEFRTLANMSFLAQQVLLTRPLPLSLATIGLTDLPAFELNWKSHYNNHQISSYDVKTAISRTGTEGVVLFGSSHAAPTGQWGPADVIQILHRLEGVWFPNFAIVSPMLGWYGGLLSFDKRHSFFDPFATLAPDTLANFYTAQMPKDYKSLNWSLTVGEHINPTRGNNVFAKQDAKPAWLTKPNYFNFCNLRAYPNLQLRKLCEILHERKFPFGHICVQTLFKMVLYHTGDLCVNKQGLIFPLWKTDLLQGDLFVVLVGELKIFASELLSRQRDHEFFLTLIEVVVYVTHWSGYPNAHVDDLRRMYAMISQKWAETVELDIQKTFNYVAISELKARQTVFYMYSLITYGGTATLSSEDIANLVKLSVLVKYGQLFENNCANKALFLQLKLRCQYVLTTRIQEIAEQYFKGPGLPHSELTQAVKGVFKFAPATLIWSPIAPQQCNALFPLISVCFEATCAAKHLYNINLLTGTTLFDGHPPGYLPQNITGHPLYVRTFGDFQFEVALTAAGSMRTTYPVLSFYYEFFLDLDSGKLMINEICALSDVSFKLLDPNWTDIVTQVPWCQQLPERLVQLHSHWLNMSAKCLVFRSPYFRNRTIYFLCNILSLSLPVRRIPEHLKDKCLAAMMDSWSRQITDTVVHWKTFPPNFYEILQKFERSSCMHIFKDTTNNVLKVHLPRFKLEFTLKQSMDTYVLHSNEFSQYRLAECQQLPDTLNGFSQYLLLRHVENALDVIVLIPAGKVLSKNGQTLLGTETICSANLTYFTYTPNHRFTDLRARSISGRLQLAALYAAVDSSLPEIRNSATGIETAIRLVRGCFSNAPLPLDVFQQIENILEFSWKNPALALLCKHLQQSSLQSAYLFRSQKDTLFTFKNVDPNIVTQYGQGYYPNVRTLLTGEEEQRIFGLRPLRQKLLVDPKIPLSWPDVFLFKVTDIYISDMELLLATFVYKEPSEKKTRSLPVMYAGTKELSKSMFTELEKSWKIHCEQPLTLLGGSVTWLYTIFCEKLNEVTSNRRQLEDSLLTFATTMPKLSACSTNYVAMYTLLKCANHISTVSMSDLVQILLAPPEDMSMVCPFLDACPIRFALFKKNVSKWLQLCVLEDRLGRLCTLSKKGRAMTETLIVKELLTTRVWDPHLFPFWLSFEVDMNLQIRPVQFVVAKELIENPASIVQLNMGEGKTRVILPMLILHAHFAKSGGPAAVDKNPVLRINILNHLFSEAFDYFHEHLTAGIMHVKFFQMPFDRDVSFTPQQIDNLLEQARYCQREAGVFLVTPESRCSLTLKRNELTQLAWNEKWYNTLKIVGMWDLVVCYLSPNDIAAFARAGPQARAIVKKSSWVSNEELMANKIFLFENFAWQDMFDESDEILKHKYQLVYAVGNPALLEALHSRLVAIRILLDTLQNNTACQAILKQANVALCIEKNAPGSFFKVFRLLPGPCIPELVHTLALAIVQLPPIELEWLHQLQKKVGEYNILHYFIDATVATQSLIPAESFFEKSHNDICLEIRGLLAYHVFVNVLQKRYRVDYGLSSTHVKRLAIPFLACDTPALRSEYSHPETVLLLTTLAYLYEGLSHVQLVDAFAVLLTFGENTRAKTYTNWLLRLGSHVDLDLSTIDKIEKIDLTNISQKEILFQTFRFNFEVINFWLLQCIFPTETMQYPCRIKATAWHLAAAQGSNPCSVGFSGTTDMHRLLPLSVALRDVPNKTLMATNGHMMDGLMKFATYTSIPPMSNSWEFLLEHAVKMGAAALIDAGAWLAGITNDDAAKKIIALVLKKGGSTLKGVTYFDEREKNWVVMNFENYYWLLHLSPIKEHETFVIFDQRRCRGSDMKLKQNAHALLTLGPHMCKDALMQGVGRMRQFGHGQTVEVMAEHYIHLELVKTVKDLCAKPSYKMVLTNEEKVIEEQPFLPLAAVLTWVLHNTVSACESGLPEWADHGMHYLRTSHYSSKDFILSEKLTLEQFYCAPVQQELICDVVMRSSKLYPRVNLEELVTCTNLYGTSSFMAVGDIGQEIERELQLEQEVEKEMEIQVCRQTPAQEIDWDYSLVTHSTAATGAKILTASNAIPLHTVVEKNLISLLPYSIHWKGKVFVTSNFLQTVDVCMQLNEFLRPVDTFLFFSTGTVLILSDREASQSLLHFWQDASVYLHNRRSISPGEESPMPLRHPGISIDYRNAKKITTGYDVSRNNLPIFMHACYAQNLFGLAPVQERTFSEELLDFPWLTIPTSVSVEKLLHTPPSLTRLGELTTAAVHRGDIDFFPARIRFADLDPVSLVQMHLFNGGTMFRWKKALYEVLPTSAAKSGALEVPIMRGVGHLIAGSDLDDLFKKKFWDNQSTKKKKKTTLTT